MGWGVRKKAMEVCIYNSLFVLIYLCVYVACGRGASVYQCIYAGKLSAQHCGYWTRNAYLLAMYSSSTYIKQSIQGFVHSYNHSFIYHAIVIGHEMILRTNLLKLTLLSFRVISFF